MNKKYIACFDSGIGGLTTLDAARRELPREDFIYYADTAHAPYGGRPKEEVLALTQACIDRLRPLGLKALLLACNAATSAAAAQLRNELDIPVLGLEPAVKPALAAISGAVIVLGTELTVREEKFHNLLNALPGRERVRSLACPGLVELIEQDIGHAAIKQYLRGLLNPYEAEMTALVLGCTHYILLRPILQSLWPQLPVFDGNAGVSRHLHHVLAQQGQLNQAGRGEILWMCSTPGEEEQQLFSAKCRRILTDYHLQRGIYDQRQL
ncbi:MAG: glutamate racemase [Clostridiales bacterium]|nr:glutamate racemase [Clostridiales bacterium]